DCGHGLVMGHYLLTNGHQRRSGAVATIAVVRGVVAYRTIRKKRRTSSASSVGCSMAAKCPPRGITVHCRTSKKRSASSRGGQGISTGNCANAIGGVMRVPAAKRSGSRRISLYSRMDDEIVPVNQ